MYDRNNYGPTSQAQMNADPQAWAARTEAPQAGWAAPMNVMSPQMIDQWDQFRQRANAQSLALNSMNGVGVPGATGNMTPGMYQDKWAALKELAGTYGGLGGLGGIKDVISKAQEESAKEKAADPKAAGEMNDMPNYTDPTNPNYYWGR
jgi:hypothetical protein